jgi:cyanophycinase
MRAVLLVLAACTEAPTAMPSTPEPATAPPEAPPDLERWLTGDAVDAEVVPTGPGLILMGGGVEPDAAFDWWVDLLAGGDVVVIRTSGSDGYNAYLFDDIGGVDSVETLLLDDRSLADHPYVRWRLETAEGVFIAGGDQADQLAMWQGTAVETALAGVLDRGGVLGGTSAGLAILSDRVFAAREGSVLSEEALGDPFHFRMSFEDDFLDLPWLAGTITDSHFSERDRLGRLAAFVARAQVDRGTSGFAGIGVDETTALVVGPDGTGTVVGEGEVHVVHLEGPPARCAPGEPLDVTLQQRVLEAGETLALPVVAAPPDSTPLVVEAGVLR